MTEKNKCLKPIITLLSILLFGFQLYSQEFLIETENFSNKGGWVVDPQFVEQMGSPYLMAHGIGKPVKNAKTIIKIKEKGNYHLWVRTINWAPGNWEAPGKFKLKIEKKTFPKVLGTNKNWNWEYVGQYNFNKKEAQIELLDLTGFNGRCDAIYFSTKNIAPPNKKNELKKWRNKMLQQTKSPNKTENFDLVIVGGGIAGCAAAISAAEKGLKVALIHDRPVLGGNASGEIRVHTEGIYGYFERILKMIDTDHYPNGSPEAYDDDEKRMKNMISYKNIHLYLNWRAYDAVSINNTVQYVDAKHTSTSERIRFKAPLFVDSTGDGWIGFWTGAKFMYGRESKSTFNEGWETHGELWSPEKADNFVMGSSVLWRSKKLETVTSFPKVPWAIEVAKDYAAVNGEWQWEFSRNDLSQIDDAEQIRDHMLKAIFGSFYNEKQKIGNEKLALKWVSSLVGKRESRRLIGDYIYTLNDVKNQVDFKDAVVLEKRSVDVHYQQNLNNPEKPNFLSEALFFRTSGYKLPYRSLYSKNINNLFMAGRDFSCSHIGLGGPRVMLTTGQMGAAVGYAASICKKYKTTPRAVYQKHLNEYMKLVLSSSNQSQNN
ncbi:FAD-dependent oxidoreductase [Lutibacter citreus]|uniref:FAD-dependent oxidoreductase n=1 Tax=Lutibacter citreus TaxID=2138210 RepID=UPI000DBE1CCB|nr:FAD-dependent oxidoreductase [Lutibacter citreus]